MHYFALSWDPHITEMKLLLSCIQSMRISSSLPKIHKHAYLILFSVSVSGEKVREERSKLSTEQSKYPVKIIQIILCDLQI